MTPNDLGKINLKKKPDQRTLENLRNIKIDMLSNTLHQISLPCIFFFPFKHSFESNTIPLLHPDKNLKSTVTDIVKSISNEFKKETIQEMKKELKIDTIVSDVKNCTRVATSAKDKTLNVEKSFYNSHKEICYPNRVLQKGRINSLEDKMVDSEARSRRNNVVVHGVEEVTGEDGLDTAYERIERGCDLDPRGICIERAQRIGRRRHNAAKPRPFIMKFLDFQDKELVTSCHHNLPLHMRMSDDLPLAIREQRRKRSQHS